MQGAVCAVPHRHSNKIVLGHGSGGKMSNDLIANTFLPPFGNSILLAGNDAGVVQLDNHSRLAISTDSHVVWPLFFSGGDIGKLAICGTVNDVACMGAKPLYLTVGFILEEGLDVEILDKVTASMQDAANEAGVHIVAGDTKVVERGKADGLFINTAGIGSLITNQEIGGQYAQQGDLVILSGTMGDHGIAVLEARGDLGFTTEIKSDVAPLNHLIETMISFSNKIHVLRDPTRGGVASTLNEIAKQSQVGITIYEQNLPVLPAVQAACEMLGFDPLYIANEGKIIAIVAREDANKVLMAMRDHPYGKDATIIGEVQHTPKGRVLMKTVLGSTRVVDVLMGELLPRIC
ncbi:MAG: hydrogenase expression/formation protein HypE [Chloroflexi bacterium]|nr:hydrogenase expression/formation protein HypE [Chloroflexota bacterium]